MRKALAVLLMLCMLAASLPAMAAEDDGVAVSLSKKCSFKSISGGNLKRLYDGSFTYNFATNEKRDPYLQITTPKNRLCYGLYICWGDDMPMPWELQTKNEAGEWVAVQQCGLNGYAHEYVPVDGLSTMRICVPSEEPIHLRIKELYVLGEGTLPDFVQVWQPTPEKADLLLLSGHPDDEYIFMGGTIPTYAGQEKRDMVVCYMTTPGSLRRAELLNGLWHAGQRTYPVLLNLPDKYSRSLETAYEYWDEQETYELVAGVIDRLQPEVMVTHDVEGEYGHGAHRVCADIALKYVKDETRWPLKKLYIHLYPENVVDMDWRVPLDAFGGKTALEVAREAFAFHKSQKGSTAPYRGKEYKFKVEDSGWFDNSLFGLAHSLVGEDVLKNDFFENIP